MDECAGSRRLLNDHLVNAVSGETPRTAGIGDGCSGGDECTGGESGAARTDQHVTVKRSGYRDAHTAQARKHGSQAKAA